MGCANHELSEELVYRFHPLFHGGRCAWFFSTPFPEEFKSPVGDWLEHKQSMANQAGTNRRHVSECELSQRNRQGDPPILRLVTLFRFTTNDYPPGHLSPICHPTNTQCHEHNPFPGAPLIVAQTLCPWTEHIRHQFFFANQSSEKI